MSGTVWVEVPAEWVVVSGMYTFLQDRGPCFGPVLAIEPDAPSAPPSTRCGCDQDPIECNHQGARGQAEAERDAARAEVTRLNARLAAIGQQYPGLTWTEPADRPEEAL